MKNNHMDAPQRAERRHSGGRHSNRPQGDSDAYLQEACHLSNCRVDYLGA